jgi:Porin PorA
MRRIVGLVLLALGIFGVVLGLLLPFYAYPKLAVVPLNQKSESISTGNLTVLYIGDVAKGGGPESIKSNVPVTATREVLGNPKAAEAKPDGNVMVWDVGLVVEDQRGTTLNSSLDHLCLDRSTNMAVQPCSGEGIEDDEDDNSIDANDSVTHQGLSYKFPFGTEKKDYQYFDNSTREAFPIRFQKTETVEGVETYKFVQTIPLTRLDEPPVDLPGKVAGQPDVPAIRVSQYYENTRTVWVEPYSGIIVKGQEEQNQTLRSSDGREVATAFRGTLAFTDATTKAAAKDAKDARSKLRLVKTVGPAVLITLGVLLTLAGLALTLLGGGPAPAQGEPVWQREPQPA